MTWRVVPQARRALDELPLDRLMVERASSTNTAAAGGNAALTSLT